MAASAPTSTHELHSRVNDGIHVQLLWRTHDDHLWVAVNDHKQDQEFSIVVRDRKRALDVFHHPFAYAAHYGIDTRPLRTDGPMPAPVLA